MKEEDIKFVPWSGGKDCPVPRGHDVSVKFRVGITDRYCNPQQFFWGYSGADTDIVGYFDHTEAERMSELFSLAPAEATHIWRGDYQRYPLQGALEIWSKDYSKWVISPYCRSDVLDAIQAGHATEIPYRERELNRLADDWDEDQWTGHYQYGWLKGRQLFTSNTPSSRPGQSTLFFTRDEWQARRKQRIPAGLIDVKQDSQQEWADDPLPTGFQAVSEEAIGWLFDNHPEAYKGFYERVDKAPEQQPDEREEGIIGMYLDAIGEAFEGNEMDDGVVFEACSALYDAGYRLNQGGGDER